MTSIFVSVGTSASALQNIIDNAPEGARIVLEEGTYRFTRTVEIDRDGITLEGQGNVTIVADACLMGEPAIQIGSPLYMEETDASVQVTENACIGARSLTMQSGHGIQAGDVIWIEQPNDAALFAEIGDTQWREDKPLRTGLAVVTAVNGNQVCLDRGLPFNFDAGLTTAEVIQMVRDVTVKGITFRGDFGASDKASFSNNVASEVGGAMIVVNASIDTNLSDIEILDPGSNGVVLGKSLNALIEDVSVKGAHNKGDGGNGYAFWLRDITDCTFTDLKAIDTRHAVLFASYTSAIRNDVHVAFTNRDVNFHGGLDQGNTVVVDMSTRTIEEQSYLSAVSFVNSGTDYGAPTDPDANNITFRHVVGTVRADSVTAHSGGVYIATLGGTDTLIGGAGDDILDGGTGNDLIHASQGDDVVLGGAGTDSFVFKFDRDQAFVQADGTKSIVTSALGTASLTGVEYLKFGSGSMSMAAAQTQILQGEAGFERTFIATTFVADDRVNAITMVGARNIGFLGNALANNVIGNAGDNLILGEGGNDRLFGGDGQDFLAGGAGDDLLHGGAGNDTLTGGAGDDTLSGRQGADTFVGSTGANIIDDFSIAQGDNVAFRGFSKLDLVASLASYLDGRSLSTDDFRFAVQSSGGLSTLVITSAQDDSLSLQNTQAIDLYSYLLA
jgi:Ca2+-binding RTX toxin-like protein